VNNSRRLFMFYCLLVSFLACGALALSWKAWPPAALPVVGLLVVASVLAENLAVNLPTGSSASISYPLSLAAILLGGPTSGAIVAAFSAVNLADIRNRKKPTVVVFNIAQLVLTSLVAGSLYLTLGGRILLNRPLTVEELPASLLPVAALVAVSFLLNVVLVGIGLSVLRGMPVLSGVRQLFSWVAPTQLPLSVLGLAIAEVVAYVHVAGLVLFAFPLIAAQQIYQRYSDLKATYLEALKSLAAALEAKDPYTRGHSERVADYSMLIAAAMGWSESAIERIRTAALLHDLGKIGVRSGTLNKPGALDADEWVEIQQHPRIGVEIISAIPFLQHALPAILHHHERVDGSGYGLGKIGDDIPLEARILAVADSYDAMTSDRPYRTPLSRDRAIDELVRGSGTQFDPAVVAAFLSTLELAGQEEFDARAVS